VTANERETASPEQTEALGAALGRTAPGGGLLGLIGELGTGKTCLVRGLARGLDADSGAVHSPSFVVATEYPGGRLPLTHVDLYRLGEMTADDPFLRELLFGRGVAAVEWMDRLGPGPTEECLLVTLHYLSSERRAVRFEAHGPLHEQWLTAALSLAARSGG